MAPWQALRTKPASDLVVPVYVCFVLCSGAFGDIFRASWQASHTQPSLDLLVHVYVCFVLALVVVVQLG
jgi:hypothetical protein